MRAHLLVTATVIGRMMTVYGDISMIIDVGITWCSEGSGIPPSIDGATEGISPFVMSSPY